MADTITLPGFVNAHSHTFQRALRGRAGGGDFWAWRELMLAEAERQTPASVRALYATTYAEMRDAGYTAVGEFHYLGVEEARAAAAAAAEAGVELVLLLAAYARGGLPRMRQESPAEYLRQLESLRDDGVRVGLAPHSVRACPREWLEELGRYAGSERLPLHVHACEQPREIEECLAEHGCRPIELLDRTGCLGPHATVVHATHADGAELDLLAETGTTVCACPTTEADLADGFLPAARIEHRGIPLCDRLRLERQDRPARGAAGARGDRPAADRQARRLLDRAAALLRRRRGRAVARARDLARDRGRLHARVAPGRRRGRRLRRARLELLRGRLQPLRRLTQNAVRSRYAVSAARPCRPQAPSYDS